MKPPLHITLIALLSLGSGSVSAQTPAPFSTIEYIDVNNIKAAQLVHGDMWRHPDSLKAACEFPKGGGVHMGYAGALWMAGYSSDGLLKVAAQTYRADGNDYWPGPIDIPGTAITYQESEKWARVWKVTRDEINTFLATPTHTLGNTPASILEWPGKDNSYAKGNNGVSLSLPIGRNFAPFVDVNQNGIYDPLAGDYPAIKGDMMLWNIFNDNGPARTLSSTEALQVEVHVSTYGYKRNSAVDNIIFYEYRIVNRSSNTLDSFVLGLYADLDLGHGGDDFVGYDSSRNLGYVYNGTMVDGNATAPGSYGGNIPVAGVRMLRAPGDTCGNISPASSFMAIHNIPSSVIGNPANGVEFNNYLRHHWRNGQPLTNDFQGPGVTSIGTGAGPNTQYVYTGNPAVTSEWTECASSNVPGDRRMVISTKPFSVLQGQVWEMAFALVASNPSAHNACPNIDISELQDISDTAQAVFCAPLAPITSVENITATKSQFLVYPNPAADIVTISHPLQGNITLKVFDATGRLVMAGQNVKAQKAEVNVEALPQGIYHVVLSEGAKYLSASFVKK